MSSLPAAAAAPHFGNAFLEGRRSRLQEELRILDERLQKAEADPYVSQFRKWISRFKVEIAAEGALLRLRGLINAYAIDLFETITEQERDNDASTVLMLDWLKKHRQILPLQGETVVINDPIADLKSSLESRADQFIAQLEALKKSSAEHSFKESEELKAEELRAAAFFQSTEALLEQEEKECVELERLIAEIESKQKSAQKEATKCSEDLKELDRKLEAARQALAGKRKRRKKFGRFIKVAAIVGLAALGAAVLQSALAAVAPNASIGIKAGAKGASIMGKVAF